MSEILIKGGRPLIGEIEIGGSKNAALPIIFATVALPGISIISRVPDIGDVKTAVEIIKRMGALVERRKNSLIIDTGNLHYERIPAELTSRLRASSYLIGACLARFGICHIAKIGGCNFCNRPIDMHLAAAAALGAEITSDMISASSLKGAQINFEKASVGATINALIMASVANGQTVIRHAAKEPHVKNLIAFLRSAGANISESEDTITVNSGVLHGGCAEIIPDMIEAGTFLLMAPMTGGEIKIRREENLELDCFLSLLSDAGLIVNDGVTHISVSGAPKGAFDVITAPHPGFPTDLQPQTAPVMAKFFGGSITECVWQNRFSYLKELSAFGVACETEGSKSLIYPSKINNAACTAPDLRGGAAAVMCALFAEGESKIKNAEVIFRGYSDFIPKLRKLGAEIEILK